MTRNTQVDGLRALAILMVVCFHLFVQYRNLYDDSFEKVAGVNISTIGTSIFLILSGFFITNTKLGCGFYQNLKKRIVRLYPVYCLSILIVYILTRFVVLPGRTVSNTDFILNLFFLNGYLKTPYVDGAHWYLTTILSSSMIYYLLYRLKRVNYWLLLWGLIVFALNMSLHFIPIGIGTKIASGLLILLGDKWSLLFIIGIYLKDFIRPNNTKGLIRIIKIAPPLLLVVLLALSIGKYAISMLLVITLCVTLVVLALNNKLTFLDNKALVFLGAASYSIYCIHQNIGYIIIREMVNDYGQYEWWMSLISVIVMIIIGVIVYICFEKPMGRLTKLIR